MQNIILYWGNGEISRVAKVYLSTYSNPYSVKAIVDKEFIKDKEIAFEDYKPEERDLFFPSVSYQGCNQLREKIFYKMLEKYKGNYKKIISNIHSQSAIARDIKLGSGCWIQEMCSIQTGAKLGHGVVCWANSHVGHSSILEDFSWITTGAVICGEVVIGKGSFIGASAVITPGIKIAEHNLIAAGAIITKDTQPFQVYLEGRNNLLNSKKSTDLLV